MPITNDHEFKSALAALTGLERRQAAAQLVRQALDLSHDSRVKAALDLAARDDASAPELAAAAVAVNAVRVTTYTQCGHNADWACQASHFVARAAQECMKPEVSAAGAWEAAMQARMARLCQAVANGEGTSNEGAEAQYQALDAYLQNKEAQS